MSLFLFFSLHCSISHIDLSYWLCLQSVKYLFLSPPSHCIIDTIHRWSMLTNSSQLCTQVKLPISYSTVSFTSEVTGEMGREGKWNMTQSNLYWLPIFPPLSIECHLWVGQISPLANGFRLNVMEERGDAISIYTFDLINSSISSIRIPSLSSFIA